MILAWVVVSRPKVPAILGTSPAESMRPSPSRAFSRNTINPATRIVDCRNAVRQSPMTCFIHWTKPSTYPLGMLNI